MKPVRLHVCPLCGDINQYGWYCDNETAHPGERPALVYEVFYPRSLLLNNGVDPESLNGLPSRSP